MSQTPTYADVTGALYLLVALSRSRLQNLNSYRPQTGNKPAPPEKTSIQYAECFDMFLAKSDIFICLESAARWACSLCCVNARQTILSYWDR